MQHKIKSKKLYNKAVKAMKSLEAITRCNGLTDIQFEAQDIEVRRMLWSTTDKLKEFIDNIDNPYFNNPSN